jgi:hypothetical protein
MANSTSLLSTARTKLEEYLLTKGLRRSSERFAILEEVYSRDDHFDAEDLYQAMAGTFLCGQPGHGLQHAGGAGRLRLGSKKPVR